ncbi:hypothetical protein [Paenibacillus sp. DMB5]|uniref:hypothetical protein n=1 Tax=Paenibacillus sp. DMB5 TaxID=1780103 RepID=UPI00076DED8B|nr:hypothetical protein [Paenibacillus sp. DMB5]KUP22393.1 hypothetical protein AWJ19_27630 [Paenibacillus sp. DMB5]
MTPETLKSTCAMFRKELEVQGASLGIMAVFDSMCSYLGGESGDLNKALGDLKEAQKTISKARHIAEVPPAVFGEGFDWEFHYKTRRKELLAVLKMPGE